MKKTSLIITMLVMVFGASAFANIFKETKLGESTKFSVLAKKSPEKFNLVYVSQKDSPVTVTIYNADGEIVSIDRIKRRKSFSKVYNFRKLEAGKYTIEIKNEDGHATQEITYNPYRQNLKMAVVMKEADKFKVMVAGFDKSKPVTVRIYNDQGKMVNEDKINAHRNFSRIYDLSNLQGNSFTFTASNGAESVVRLKEIE